jgi:hypothetical protein
MNAEELVKAYIAIRDKKAEIKARQAEELKPYDTALIKLEGAMQELLDQTGVESLKTAAGTAYKTTRTSVTIADKAAFMDHIEKNHDFDLLDVRANKTAIEGYLEAHQDLPPGVNIVRMSAVNFRR